MRISLIGTGAMFLLSAVVNFVALDVLFDDSVEYYLGMTADDFRGLYYGFAAIGIAFVTVGALVPLPKPEEPGKRRPSSRGRGPT